MKRWVEDQGHNLRVDDLSVVIDFTDYRRRWWQRSAEPAIRYEVVTQVTRWGFEATEIGWLRYHLIALREGLL